MKVIKNFFWNAGYQLFAIIIPFITIPYVNRILGPTGVGINAYTNSIVQYFILLGSLGINIYGSREIAYRRNNPKELSVLFWELVIVRISAMFVACIGYIIFCTITTKYHVFFVIQGVMLLGTAFDISWFFQGIENFRVTVLRNVTVKVLTLISVFVFVKSKSDVGIYVFIIAFSQAVGYLSLWPYAHKYIKRVSLRTLHGFHHLRPTVMLLIPQLATQIYLQLNKTMLGSMQGVQASGFYENSDKLIKIILALVTATGTVLLPHVANSFAKGDNNAVKKSLVTSIHFILCLAFPLTFGLMLIAHPFTIVFFSNQFLPVASLLAIESLIIICIGISNAIGIQYLLPTNQVGAYTRSVVFGSISNIILNIPLIYFLGATGAVIATVVSEFLVTAYQVFFVRNQVSMDQLFSETWKYLLSSLIMIVPAYIIGSGIQNLYLKIGVEVFVAIVVYISAMVLLRPNKLIHYLNELRRS